MNLAMEEYRLTKPKIEANSDWFTITFLRPDLQKESYQKGMGRYQESASKVPEKMPEKYLKIIELITTKPGLPQEEIARELHEPLSTIRSRLRKLKKDGQLRHVGPDKGGHWEIIKRT